MNEASLYELGILAQRASGLGVCIPCTCAPAPHNIDAPRCDKAEAERLSKGLWSLYEGWVRLK